MTRERVVIDTNVLISGLLSTTSTPAQAVERAVTKAQLVATLATLPELIEKLHSPRFDRYVRRERRDALLERVASLVEISDVLQAIRASHVRLLVDEYDGAAPFISLSSRSGH